MTLDQLKALSQKTTAQCIDEKCLALAELLKKKNRAYGDSALNPKRIFSKASALEQIYVRLDDKLSRQMDGNATDFPDEDLVMDILGYLILLQIAKDRFIEAECKAQPVPFRSNKKIESIHDEDPESPIPQKEAAKHFPQERREVQANPFPSRAADQEFLAERAEQIKQWEAIVYSEFSPQRFVFEYRDNKQLPFRIRCIDGDADLDVTGGDFENTMNFLREAYQASIERLRRVSEAPPSKMGFKTPMPFDSQVPPIAPFKPPVA